MIYQYKKLSIKILVVKYQIVKGMQTLMKVTLAIISHNAEDYIKKCLESCITQNYKDLDIVVVDDNSDDNTVELIKSYQMNDPRINLIQHPTNKSALQARATAVKYAKADYVWFIDSDDSIEPRAVGHIAAALKENNFPDMLTFGSNDFDENGNLKRKFYDWGRKRKLNDWRNDSDFRPYTRVTKRSILNEVVKVIPEDLYLYRHNDFFMVNLIKLHVNTKFSIEKRLYNYTLSSSSVTNQKDIASINKHIELMAVLLREYKKSALQVPQKNINIDAFVNKHRAKLITYAINQYKENPQHFLHTLKKAYSDEREIIISLTTYSKRIHTVNQVVSSLLNQSVAVDKIILWLDETEFTLSELPAQLTNLISSDFEIKFCPNYKSYKKLIPTLALYPDATLITFDDDINYPIDQVEKLLLAHFQQPGAIIAHTARNICIKNGVLQPYKKWLHVFEEQVGKPLLNTLPIGVSGVLYPNGSLNKEVKNIENFIKLAPHGDDLWFKCMSLLNGTKVVCLSAGYDLMSKEIEGSREIGLWEMVNLNSDSNYNQLKQISDYYYEIKKVIFSEQFCSKKIDNSDLVDFYASLKLIRTKENLSHSELKTLLSNITKLKLMHSDSNNTTFKNQEPALNKINSTDYSAFKLANKLFHEKSYYEAAIIYSYLNSQNTGFKYYRLNLETSIAKYKEISGGKIPKIRFDKNIDGKQFDISALDTIIDIDNQCPKSFFESEFEKVKHLPDASLLKANFYKQTDAEWSTSLNKWLENWEVGAVILNNGSGSVFDRLSSVKNLKKDGPLVTIFMSSYNAESTIGYAVRSLLEQSYENIEVIVVDDCSTDNTKKILEKIAAKDNRVSLHFNEKNRGTYNNRNLGLSKAKGKYFTVLDADDYCLPERIKQQVDILSASKGKLIAVAGAWVRICPDGYFVCRHTWTASYLQPAVATLMFEREKVVKKIGFYDGVRFGADSEYLERMKKVFGGATILETDLPLTLAAYLETSLTGNKETGIDPILGTSQIRLDYARSWKNWHKTSPKLFMPINAEKRKFKAPEKMWA